MTRRLDSARSACFDRHMKQTLTDLRVDLVKVLEVDNLWDHLIDVFPDEYLSHIVVKEPRANKVRHLLDHLIKRPESAFWTFVGALFHPTVGQGWIAVNILTRYEEHGGQVSESVAQLQRDYHQRLRPHTVNPLQQPPQSPPPPPPPPSQGHGTQASLSLQDQQQQRQQQQQCQQQQQQQQQHQQHQDQPRWHLEAQGETPASREDHNSGANSLPLFSQSARGMPVVTETMTTTEVSMDTQDDVLGPSRRAVGGGDGEGSVYWEKRNENPHGVYKMESMPRGAALIINNESFHPLGSRLGTARDCDLLRGLFQDWLGFEVLVRNNLTAQGMKRELSEFLRRLTDGQFDSCMVGILTHGAREEALFGIDGSLTNGTPTPGTYITTYFLREQFGSVNCQAMAGKPKLFIIQACRGEQQDSRNEPPPSRYDAGLEVGQEIHPCRDQPDKTDVIFLYAAVPRHLAVRNFFIPKLVDVFTLHAGSKHLFDLQMLICQELSRETHENAFFIPEAKTTLSAYWYLNPPPRPSREL